MNNARIDSLFALGVPPGNYRLPHPRLGLPVVLLVRLVVLRAFELLREHGHPLPAMKEDEITAALRSVIENDLRQTGAVVRGFDRRTFETVARQAQVANHDLTKHAKAPDLCFRLSDHEREPRPVVSEHDALFVECKPVGRAHPVGSKYCNAGICRFVDGDYAWAMEEALMLGYVRHDFTIAKNLIPAMRKPGRLERLKTSELPRPVEAPDPATGGRAEPLHVSRHLREFSWIDGSGAATDIFIYHSWHDCDEPVEAQRARPGAKRSRAKL